MGTARNTKIPMSPVQLSKMHEKISLSDDENFNAHL